MRGDGENVDRAATSWMVLFGGAFWISSSSLCALSDDFSSTGFKLRLFNPLFLRKRNASHCTRRTK